jgi:hypothetical protein
MSLIEDIQRDALSACFQNFMKLLETKLSDNRTRLDDATGDEVLKLQGANRQLKELLKIKEPVLPIRHHDGAFD